MNEKIYMADNVGFVELLDTFGDDLTVVNAARVSFDKESTELADGDKRLITYLADHDHISPFFHPQIRLRIKMPLFVAREYFRHQIGLARNEVSRRYVDTMPECWIPSETDMRSRDTKVKQGSKDTPIEESQTAHALLKQQITQACQAYQDLINMGVAPEVARVVLPQSMYTLFCETGSLAAYARICNLRLDPTAQKEIRLFATAINELMSGAFPVAWAALSKNFKQT